MSKAIKNQAARVMKLAKERGVRLATVESCTAGLLAHMLSEGAAASDILHGGFIVYTKENKTAAVGGAEGLVERAHGGKRRGQPQGPRIEGRRGP
jgi:nicotinamide-nucleotide amidase